MMVNICILNNPFVGVSDQLEYLRCYFNENKIKFKVTRRLDPGCINIVFENFNRSTRDYLLQFYKTYNKRIIILMTEHIDFIDSQILFHGKHWLNSNYMSVETQLKRLQNLLELTSCVSFFVTLGDLPFLKGLENMIPEISILRVPFPSSKMFKSFNSCHLNYEYDFLFNGYVTDFRKEIIGLIGKHFTISELSNIYTSRQRAERLRKAKVILDIPQAADWMWVSPMRIMNALKNGKLCVHIGKVDCSVIGNICPSIDFNSFCLDVDLKNILTNRFDIFTTFIERYEEETEFFNKKYADDIIYIFNDLYKLELM